MGLCLYIGRDQGFQFEITAVVHLFYCVSVTDNFRDINFILAIL